MSNVIEVRGLAKRYGLFSLDEVSFDVPAGYITGFVGPNGSGKTTVIKLMLGMISSDAGSVRLFGEFGAGVCNGRIGVVTDTPLFVEDWSVKDVGSALSPFFRGWNPEVFSGYLSRFGLEPQKKVKELSRGMKVKLQIASALSHGADLLVLDEPTSGLDPVARDEICDLLRGFAVDEGRSVFFSTHITSDLEKTADYITFVLNGSVVFSGTKDALQEKYVRVTGGPDSVSPDLRGLIIGYREHPTGFEGIAESARIRSLPRSVAVEAASLEEIVIFMSKGEKTGE